MEFHRTNKSASREGEQGLSMQREQRVQRCGAALCMGVTNGLVELGWLPKEEEGIGLGNQLIQSLECPPKELALGAMGNP